jgi:hypothetical protein
MTDLMANREKFRRIVLLVMTEEVFPWVQEKIKNPSELHFTLPSWVPFAGNMSFCQRTSRRSGARSSW